MSIPHGDSHLQDPGAAYASGAAPRGAILVDRDLHALIGEAILCSSSDLSIEANQIQPASIDLRLGSTAYRIRAGFTPERVPVETRLEELSSSRLSLEGEGAVLERGCVYLVQLEEALNLPADMHGRFNPRSSTGRCDLFTRVLVPGWSRFDETPPGWSGKLWIEIAPLSFPVRLTRGDRLCQMRLQAGSAALSSAELIELHETTPLAFDGQHPIPSKDMHFDEQGGMHVRLGLAGRDPVAWRAALHTDVVQFKATHLHPREEFWEPIHATASTPQPNSSNRNLSPHLERCVLEPGRFYLFASRERIRIPPQYAAEMLPVDVGIGELRNNYAGFFDNGFGWDEGDGNSQSVAGQAATEGPLPGTPAVLEVRAHDVPFLVEDGQTFARLRMFRSASIPDRLYGRGRKGPSYRHQDLTLARPFR